jgi:hypothetical protein
MDDGKATVNGLSSTVCFAGVVARVEGLPGRNSLFEARRSKGCLMRYSPRRWTEDSRQWNYGL